jgi:hypothetical protein
VLGHAFSPSPLRHNVSHIIIHMKYRCKQINSTHMATHKMKHATTLASTKGETNKIQIYKLTGTEKKIILRA